MFRDDKFAHLNAYDMYPSSSGFSRPDATLCKDVASGREKPLLAGYMTC